jgi:heme oxygenase (biliverdin-producing, ferredoxin)
LSDRPAPQPDLPQRLRQGTQSLHRQAERSGVMARLLGRRLDRTDYAALVANLQALYAALEPALSSWPDARALGPLGRAEALEADLRALRDPGDAVPAPVAATHDYVARLSHVGATAPHRLAAHAYVRYLGDLHGGQVLQRLVSELYRLPGVTGTRFYQFGPPEHVQQLRDAVRAWLGAVPLTAAQADDVVAEAQWAFEAHCRMFEQLDAA